MCSELCGVNHQSMPIEIHVVTDEAFLKWVEESKIKYANKNVFLADVVKEPNVEDITKEFTDGIKTQAPAS